MIQLFQNITFSIRSKVQSMPRVLYLYAPRLRFLNCNLRMPISMSEVRRVADTSGCLPSVLLLPH